MTAAAKLKDPALHALRRRLEKWELEHLREHAAQQAERCEQLQERCDSLQERLERAEDIAESWREDTMRLLEESLGEDDAPGLTQDGRLVVVKGAAATEAAALPAIGSDFNGGTYAGVTTNKQGELYALILLPDKPTEELTWQDALKWAKSLDADLPNRVEGALLFANLPDAFEKEWHWTNEQCSGAASYAWYQYFDGGSQGTGRKSYEGRARAVRRFPIDPSILRGESPAAE